jgi:hypothetical protein
MFKPVLKTKRKKFINKSQSAMKIQKLEQHILNQSSLRTQLDNPLKELDTSLDR